MPENQFASPALNIDALQGKRMQVRIEIQCVAEALNEGNGAAARLAVRGGNAGPAADRGKMARTKICNTSLTREES